MNKNTENTEEIECPYCEWECENSDEMDEELNEGLVECDNCGKIFTYTRHFKITYSSQQRDDKYD